MTEEETKIDKENPERSKVMNGLARTINVIGGASIIVYDATANLVEKLYSGIKKTPELTSKVRGMFVKGNPFDGYKEVRHIHHKIAEHEKQIKNLYFEIGKEGSKSQETESAMASEIVGKLIQDVRDHENEILRLKKRIVEFKEDKAAEVLRKKEIKKEAKLNKLRERAQKQKASDEDITRSLESIIKKAIKSAEFESRSQADIFNKVIHDLLDPEMEIKCLAAAELGKIGNKAAVPVLMEMVKYDHSELTSEVINSLINIDDSRALPLFKEQMSSSKYRVRIGCLRGLYKLAKDDEAMPFLIDALRDDHPEVRRIALTFIGWKDYSEATPSVLQCLRDEEVRVKKAAISALANIKDETAVLPLIKLLPDKDLEIREKAYEAIKVITREEIVFQIHATGNELKDSVDQLLKWWEKTRLERGQEMIKAEPAEMQSEISEASETTAEPEVKPEAATEPEAPQDQVMESKQDAEDQNSSDEPTESV
ncbi:MAG: HEAT repeat domain-containing protein [Desulfobacterales bacterium]|nr:HEAT repeat domain-containing protein [Desulfobacterales bacterium]